VVPVSLVIVMIEPKALLFPGEWLKESIDDDDDEHDHPAKPVVKIVRDDLEDLIRDEIYGGGITAHDVGGEKVICIKYANVGKLATNIARRATIGH
jgi:hypothetical protein